MKAFKLPARFLLKIAKTISMVGLMASPWVHAQTNIRSGKVKLLGIVSAKRSPFFPEVPTVAEQGFKGADLDIWFGLWAPTTHHQMFWCA